MAYKAVVLLSGGLDSAVCLEMAKREGLELYALSIDYGQRHAPEELATAYKIAMASHAKHRVCTAHIPSGGPLLGHGDIPKDRTKEQMAEGVAPTYVPGRNRVLLSLAGAWAEDLGAVEIHFGGNKDDAAGYPDCRWEFLCAFVDTFDKDMTIAAPLLNLTKAEVIAKAMELGINIAETWSCYDPQSGKPCLRCDACILRDGQ